MTTKNQNLLRADLAISNLSSDGGLLSPEQANQFIDMIQEEPTILRQARVIRMGAPSVKVNRVGFGSRILRAAVQSGGAQDDGDNARYVRAADRAKVTTSQIQLNDSELIAEVRLPYEVLEDNIEGDNFEAHVMRLIAERAALDLEEWALWADTASGDAMLALQNGWLKRMTAHVADNAGAGPNPDLFSNALLALPQKYLRDLNKLRAFISMKNTIKYRKAVSARMTGYGDSALQNNIPLQAHGLQIEGAAMLYADTVGETGFVTFPQNLLFGIRRQITVETDKDIRSREYIIVLTLRAALQIDDAAATVKLTNIGS